MDPQEDRLQTEISLLESMYPEQVQYHGKAREVSYRTEDATFTVRLPSEYLISALPEVLAARKGRADLREQLKQRIKQFEIAEEILDSVILAFNETVEAADSTRADGRSNGDEHSAHAAHSAPEGKATIVVWLHHLLNTNKRKQALSPSATTVSGITKPGYPGVLVYSGPSKAVHEHVNELKQHNWQAFQVRLEDDEEWAFAHGAGVKEVEAMKEVVAEVGDARKEVFMEAMRMK